MKILNIIALFHNWLVDKDFLWWPFSFLRPHRHEIMTLKRTGTMTLYFGGVGFLMFAILALINNAFSFQYLVSILISCFGGFFLWFSLITKPLWNLRARQLSHK